MVSRKLSGINSIILFDIIAVALGYLFFLFFIVGQFFGETEISNILISWSWIAIIFIAMPALILRDQLERII